MDRPFSYFTEDKGSIGMIADLLDAVYRHYPVGYQHFAKRYPGYMKMEEIVAKKMDIECNDPNSISNRFFEELKAALPDHDLENKNYLNFPNYSFVIRLLSEDGGDVVHELDLNVVISLVSNYYSIALIDTYGVRGITKKSTEREGLDSRQTIYSFYSSIHRIGSEMVSLIEDRIKRYFPDKRFAHHSLLMEPPLIARVSPFRGTQGEDRASSFWELLFSNNYVSDAVVLE